jgi:putative hemolysin
MTAMNTSLLPQISLQHNEVSRDLLSASSPPLGVHKAPLLEALWARHDEDVEAAQRLRWRVFYQEMGARLKPPRGTPQGVDADLYDPHCEHLIVRTVENDQAPSEVVGTYRVLTPAAAKRVGGLYSDTEFDLVRLARLRPGMVELGRSCTAPEWRHGSVIMMLWASLGAFVQRNGLELVVGCASVSMHDGGHQAADLWQALRQDHLAPPDEHVRARLPLPVDELATGRPATMPALIKGYLRCGGKMLGPPAWDPDFGTADFPMMLRLSEMPASYRRRFIEA